MDLRVGDYLFKSVSLLCLLQQGSIQWRQAVLQSSKALLAMCWDRRHGLCCCKNIYSVKNNFLVPWWKSKKIGRHFVPTIIHELWWCSGPGTWHITLRKLFWTDWLTGNVIDGSTALWWSSGACLQSQILLWPFIFHKRKNSLCKVGLHS